MSSHVVNQENRKNIRWSMLLPVKVYSAAYGEFDAVAINISKKGMFIQTFDPLPLGTELDIKIGKNEESFIVKCVVKSHYYMTISSHNMPSSFTGMGLLFQSFENPELEEDELDFHLIN